MVFVVVYFPIDFIMMLVVMRHCRDILYNFELKELIRKTILVED
jgi:hypothetical protein